MSNTVAYEIKAIDRITSVYRSIIGVNRKTKRGVEKLNKTINKTQSRGKIDIGKLRASFIKMERRVLQVPGRIYRKFENMGKRLGPIGKVMAGIFTFQAIKNGARRIKDFTIGAINDASDLTEAYNQANVVFGQGFEGIQKFANKASDAVGMSKADTFEAASSFASLFKNIGVGEGQVAKLSESAVRLAADLGSFKNMKSEEAIQALLATLKGETEPAARFGVLLDEATLKNKALQMGLIKTTKGVLPKAIKTQAIYASILDQTKDAQGDFARTQNSYANLLKRLSSRWENLSGKIGDNFLPYAEKVAQWGIRALDWIAANGAAIKKWTIRILKVGAAFLTLYGITKTVLFSQSLYAGVIAGAKLWWGWLTKVVGVLPMLWRGLKAGIVAMKGFNLVARMSPFGWISLAIGGIILLASQWDWLRDKLYKIGRWMLDNHPFKWMFTLIEKVFPNFREGLMKMINGILAALKKVGGWIMENLLKPLGKLLDMDFSADAEVKFVGGDISNLPLVNQLGIPNAKGPYANQPAFTGENPKNKFNYEDALAGFSGAKGGKGGGNNPLGKRMAGLVEGGGQQIKNISIQIDKLVERMIIETQKLSMSEAQIREHISRTLLTAVNDVNQMG